MFLFLPLNVFAAPGWAKDIRNFPTQFSIRDCSGQSCNTSLATTQHAFNLSNQGDTVFYYGTSSNISMSAGGSGAMVIYGVLSGLNPSTLYSSSLYVCTDNMNISTSYINYDFYIGSEQNSVAQRNSHGYDRFLFTGTALDANPYVRYASGGSPIIQSFDNCYSRTILFNPTGNYRFIGMSMKATTNTSGKIYILGYDLEPLGSVNNLTSADISHAVQTSGLATATSVTQVQSSINEVKQEISGMQQEQQQTNEKLDDVNDNITNEDMPDNTDVSDISVSPNTPISDLVTLPITFLNSLVQNTGGSCSNYQLPFFFGNTISFPCFTIGQYLGDEIENIIDMMICLFMIYNIAILAISIFEDITSLRDSYDNLYTPKHEYSGYKPKHGGGD